MECIKYSSREKSHRKQQQQKFAMEGKMCYIVQFVLPFTRATMSAIVENVWFAISFIMNMNTFDTRFA